jgi:hypothetical protein
MATAAASTTTTDETSQAVANSIDAAIQELQNMSIEEEEEEPFPAPVKEKDYFDSSEAKNCSLVTRPAPSQSDRRVLENRIEKLQRMSR